MSRATALAVLLLAVAGCPAPSPPTDARPDVLGADTTPLDAPVEAAMDAPEPQDAPTDAAPGCNPDGGIECDGDWAEQCDPACAPTECCSPQEGQFRCVPRDAAGRCPAADIWLDGTQIADNYAVQWRYFPPGNCAIQEGCVAAPGWRRLLRFDTWTPNTGGADMYIGPPNASAAFFEFSACHRHFHFNSYADYRLRRADGTEAGQGHKQAFCLEDFYHYPRRPDEPAEGPGAAYTCSNQGIQMGWQDVYGRHLDCQWVDVTDVAPGTYSLHIALNTERILNESDYTNNEAAVPVTVPPLATTDPTSACAAPVRGFDRECGFTLEGTHACTPGAPVEVGCSSACGLGRCTGNTVLRICPGDAPCHVQDSLAANDDSRCVRGACGSGGDCCSRAQFVCPAGGMYTVLWGAHDSSESAATTCEVAVR